MTAPDVQSAAPRSQKDSAVAHILILMGGTGASQVLTALSAPILTRLYSPHDFGLYAIALAFVNLFAAVVALRYETAIMLPRSNRSAANVMVLCFFVVFGVTGVALMACLLGLTIPLSKGHISLDWFSVLLIPLAVLFCGIQLVLRFWCMRFREFSTITHIVMVQTVITLGVQIAAALLFPADAAYLILGTALGFGISILVAIPKIIQTFPSALARSVRTSRLIAVGKRHRRFPLFATPYSFVSQAVGRLVLLILSLFVPTTVLGEFALAQRVVYLPVSVLTSAMSQVFYSRAVQQLDDPKLHLMIRRIMVAGALVFVPVLAFNFFFSGEIFSIAFGARWAEAGRFAAWLGISSGFLALMVWLDRIFDIRGRQLLAFILEATADSICLTILAVAMYLTRDPVIGVASYALSFSTYLLVWAYTAFRIAAFPQRFYANVVSALMASAAFAACVMGVAELVTSNRMGQASVFIVLNLPVLLLGVLIGRNGLRQRESVIGPLRI